MEVVLPPGVMRSGHAGCLGNSVETRHANWSERAKRHRHSHRSSPSDKRHGHSHRSENGIGHRCSHRCSPSDRRHSYGPHSENNMGLMHDFQAKSR